MEWLKEVSKYHNEYIKSVKALGEFNYAEDIVQQMYLKLHDYNLKDKVVVNGVVSRGYIWFVLRSLCYDYKRQKAKAKKVSIGEGFDILDEFMIIDTMSYDDAYGLMLSRIDNEVDTWSHYDKRLFKIYSQSNMSMRNIEEGSNISLQSIFNTITNCKQRLKDNVGEHYKYFINKDYEEL